MGNLGWSWNSFGACFGFFYGKCWAQLISHASNQNFYSALGSWPGFPFLPSGPDYDFGNCCHALGDAWSHEFCCPGTLALQTLTSGALAGYGNLSLGSLVVSQLIL